MDPEPTAWSECETDHSDVLVYRRTEDESAAESVVAAVSNLTGMDPGTMQPLSEVLDPDALNTLCTHEPEDEQQTARRVKFRFHGCDVIVYGDGRTLVSQTAQ